jgi:hypothetical protein
LLDGSADEAQAALAPYGVHKIVPLKDAGADLAESPDARARALAAAIELLSLKALLGLATTPGRDLLARPAAGWLRPDRRYALVSDSWKSIPPSNRF